MSGAVISVVDVWDTGFHATVDITVTDAILSNWGLEVTWPSGHGIVTQVAYNAASLLCQDAFLSVFRPASWTQTLNSGTTATVDIMASYTVSISSDFVISNTNLRILTL